MWGPSYGGLLTCSSIPRYGIWGNNMSHTKTAQIKLLNRVKRIRGQMDSVERALASEDHDCADVLMLLAAARGGINGLMAEVLEDHIRLHLLKDGHAPLTPELGEDLIDLVRAYLK
jgi:FrmR/RcnR family transcriptional regulator, repressor of rcnA expression